MGLAMSAVVCANTWLPCTVCSHLSSLGDREERGARGRSESDRAPGSEAELKLGVEQAAVEVQGLQERRESNKTASTRTGQPETAKKGTTQAAKEQLGVASKLGSKAEHQDTQPPIEGKPGAVPRPCCHESQCMAKGLADRAMPAAAHSAAAATCPPARPP